MKKYFETPAVNMTLLESTDLIMASAELVKKNGSLGTVKDEAEAANNLWMGAGDGWL